MRWNVGELLDALRTRNEPTRSAIRRRLAALRDEETARATAARARAVNENGRKEKSSHVTHH